jgi:hypothetical protein
MGVTRDLFSWNAADPADALDEVVSSSRPGYRSTTASIREDVQCLRAGLPRPARHTHALNERPAARSPRWRARVVSAQAAHRRQASMLADCNLHTSSGFDERHGLCCGLSRTPDDDVAAASRDGATLKLPKTSARPPGAGLRRLRHKGRGSSFPSPSSSPTRTRAPTSRREMLYTALTRAARTIFVEAARRRGRAAAAVTRAGATAV